MPMSTGMAQPTMMSSTGMMPTTGMMPSTGMVSNIGSGLMHGTGGATTAIGTVGTGMGPNLIGLPHVISNPACRKCSGTAWNTLKNRECRKCVCHKCLGTGFNSKKNIPCKKIKTGLL